MLAPIACSIAIPLNLRRQKSGPMSKNDCKATTVMAISQTAMIVAVIRPAVRLAYLGNMKYITVNISMIETVKGYMHYP